MTVEIRDIASQANEKYNEAKLNKGNPKQVVLVAISDWLKENYAFYTFDDTEEVYFFDETEGYFVPGGETFIAGKVQSILELAELDEIASRFFADEVVGHIKRSTFFKRADFKESQSLLCLKNGVLDVRSLELVSHSSEYKILTRLEVNFKLDADCPKIKQFLHEVLRPDDILVMEELAGYLLHRDNRFQTAFMFLGEGSNGKSVLLNVLRKMLGEKNVACISLQELEENRFSLSRIYQKHANIFSDLSADALKGTGKFKILTGQDWLDAEVKFGGYISFQSYAKLLFSANRLPYTDDKSGAFFRRWIFFEFPNTFDGGAEKRSLMDELTTEDELSGLLNLALAGLARLLAQNQFSNSKSTEAKREDYIRRSDSVAAFAMDCLEQAMDSEAPKKRLWDEYLAYCGRQKITNLSERLFFTQLKKQWSMEETRPKIEGSRVLCIRGVRFKEQKVENGAKNDQNGQTCQGCQPFSLSKLYENSQEKEEGKKPDMSDIPDQVPACKGDSPSKKVLFIVSCPAWKGADGQIYGAFSAREKAELPNAEAEWAIKTGLAQPVHGVV